MNTRRFALVLLFALAALVATLLAAAPALAQCAMCKQSVAASSNGAAVARGLNLAVLVLLVPPVAIFAGIFGVFYRYRNVQDKKDRADG